MDRAHGPGPSNTDPTDERGNSVGEGCATTLASISSSPPGGAIDARQPSSIDGMVLFGWNAVEIRWNQNASGITMPDIVLTELGGDGVAPGVSGFSLVGPDVIRIDLDNRIEPGTRLIVTHRASCTRACLGYLPADANQDGLVSTNDINALIDSINLVPRRILPSYASDINRSGVTTGSDILRLIDLLNGADEFDVWITRELPTSPCE